MFNLKSPISRTIFTRAGLLSSLFLCACTGPSSSSNSAETATATATSTPITSPSATPVPVSDFSWKPLRIGGGGWICGMDIAPDGTMVSRADTYGAFYWTGSEWKPLVTSNSMPASELQSIASDGVYEIRIAPTNTNRFYMMYLGAIYRSENRGSTWIKTAFTPVTAAANDSFHFYGQKMAVDPANADVVYTGTPQDGLWVTSNAGGSWTRVASVPSSLAVNGIYAGITGIAFDPTSGLTSGKTNTLYASSYGNGVYRSSNAGVSWTHLTGGPTDVTHGKVANDGVYYVAGDANSHVWAFQLGVWTNITPVAGNWATVVTDPFNAAHIIAVQMSGNISISLNRGTSWSGLNSGGSRTAVDIPWLAWTTEYYMSTADLFLDPLVQNKLWFAEGIGVWWANVATNAPTNVNVAWNSQNLGIEQLVTNFILSVPGGNLILGAWDRPVFTVKDPNSFPTSHGPDKQFPIVAGWAFDYAVNNVNYIAGIMNIDRTGVEKSGYSLDGGATWNPFASYPPFQATGKIGGSLAVSSASNLLWAPEVNGNPYYTLNGGATWTQAVFPGAATTGETGWGQQFNYNRHIAVSDRVTLGTFYAYNYLKGLYRSTDGAVNWTLIKSGQITINSQYNAILQSVPGKAGHLFFTGGPLNYAGAVHPVNETFMHSVDGGVTWTAIPSVLEVSAFGFGKPSVDGAYPSLYIAGWVNQIYGIFRSDNEGQSWTLLGKFPNNSLDVIKAVSGDLNTYGKVYVGFQGSGFAFFGP